MSLSETILSLGSNLGDRHRALHSAIAALGATPGITLTRLSPIYESEPQAVHPEHSRQLFLNQIAIATTTLMLSEFSTTIHALEEHLGRVRGSQPNQPRYIDLDIITFGTLRVSSREITLPHPRAAIRRFVLQPLADLRPHFVLPGYRTSVSQLLNALPITPRVWQWQTNPS